MSLDSHIVSLRSLFRPDLAGELDTSVDLRLGEHRFCVAIADGRVEAGRGDATDADVTIQTEPGTLLAIVHGRRTLADAQRAGDIVITGDMLAAEHFLGLFPLPVAAA